MVKKNATANLRAVVPTEQEKAASVAKRAQLDDKARRAVKASVRNFWKQNVDANMGSISEVPDDLIYKWFVHLSRCDNVDKTVQNNREFNHKSAKMKDLRWYAKENLKTNFGEIRGQFWLDEKVLPARPCRMTGKHGEFITEFGVPDDWKRLTDEDFRQLKAQVEFELGEDEGAEELQMMMQVGQLLQGSSSSSSGSGGANVEGAAAIIKKEGPTAGEILADKVEALRATKDQTLARMRTVNLETRCMWSKALKLQETTGKIASRSSAQSVQRLRRSRFAPLKSLSVGPSTVTRRSSRSWRSWRFWQRSATSSTTRH